MLNNYFIYSILVLARSSHIQMPHSTALKTRTENIWFSAVQSIHLDFATLYKSLLQFRMDSISVNLNGIWLR